MNIIPPSAYDGPDTHLTPLFYLNALTSQTACNSSGLIHILDETIHIIWDEARARKQGTDWVNQHPILLLYLTQLCHLGGLGVLHGPTSVRYSWAYDYCTTRSK